MKFKDYLENDKYENVFDGEDLFDKHDIIAEPRLERELNNLYVVQENGDSYKKGEKLEISEKEQYTLWLEFLENKFSCKEQDNEI